MDYPVNTCIIPGLAYVRKRADADIRYRYMNTISEAPNFRPFCDSKMGGGPKKNREAVLYAEEKIKVAKQ